MTKQQKLEREIEALAPPLQDWVRAQGWRSLRPIQSQAIPEILSDSSDEHDFILSSATATGKTEAAFLPLLTKLYERQEDARPSFEILYLSPLKALINDMYGRACDLGKCVHRSVYRRHGDVRGSERAEGELRSRGVLLTTPESLEAQFIKAPENVAFVFADLQFIVVDELHAYFESPRGPQVLSLLTRVETLLAQERNDPQFRIPRIALSATVSGRDPEDEAEVKTFLRPEDSERVRILCPGAVKNSLKVYLKVFKEAPKSSRPKGPRPSLHAPGLRHAEEDLAPPVAMAEIARNLFDVFSKCRKGLIFTNSRREAEELAELLNRRARKKGLVSEPEDCADETVPSTRRPEGLEREFLPESRFFWPHHGSLDNWIRARAEKVMRDSNNASTLVCTTTLELGIDVGTVDATAQIGPGFSVASLRQRLGRSGRREGMTPTLHAYVRESDFGGDAHLVERLHLQTFRTLAQISLLGRGVFEAPDTGRLNLSTMIQQLLSCVHQYQEEQGLSLELGRRLLAEKGPFGSALELVEPLVDRLATKYKPLVERQNGRIFLTEAGRRYVTRFTFYAAFNTPQEYTLRAGGRRIGAFAPRYPYGPGDQFLFAGTYWEVQRVDHVRRTMEVTRSSAGRAPYFEGDALAPSDPVVQEMRELFTRPETSVLPPHTSINDAARRAIEEGREAYRGLTEEHGRIASYSDGVILFPWVGTRKQITLVSALKWRGLRASAMDVAVLVRGAKREEVCKELGRLRDPPLPDEHDLARYGSRLALEKHDYLLSPALKRMNFASSKLDLSTLPETIEPLVCS